MVDWQKLVTWAAEQNASDVFWKAHTRPACRIKGTVQIMEDWPVLSAEDTEELARSLMREREWEKFLDYPEKDIGMSIEGVCRLRINIYRERDACAIVMRIIPLVVKTVDELGLPDVLKTVAMYPQGLVLVTGPTGCGKSTTLAAMLDHINKNRRAHIVTVEDPIEYVHHHARAAVNQREVGQDTGSFARALRSALRADPDVLLVGEMRDLETIQTVLTMAETGHLVFGTLHTNDAAQAIDRIVDVFPAERQQQIRVQLANTLAGVICQQLLPRIGGGRVAAFEVLVATHAVRNLIKEGKTNQLRNVMLTGQDEGMTTLEASLSDLVTRGLITYEDALSRSLFPKEVAKPRPVAPAAEATA